MHQGVTNRYANVINSLGTRTLGACIRRWSVEGSPCPGLGLYALQSKEM